MAFLDIKGVSKRFGGLMALSDVDMQVEKGEIFDSVFQLDRLDLRHLSPLGWLPRH